MAATHHQTPQPRFTNLEEMLELLREKTADEERVSLARMMDAVGRRSFGPILVLAGLIAVSPLSGIPGMPTTVALLVIIVATQLLFRRDQFWPPEWILRRSVSRHRFDQALRFTQPAARVIDRFLRPRLESLTRSVGTYGIAVLCVLIALTMPPLELMPFAAGSAGTALTAFGLSLIAHDGVLALIGLAFTAVTLGFAAYSLQAVK